MTTWLKDSWKLNHKKFVFVKFGDTGVLLSYWLDVIIFNVIIEAFYITLSITYIQYCIMTINALKLNYVVVEIK